MTDIDIIIPVYNENEIIVNLLDNLNKKVKYDFKVFICYDNDEDTTIKEILNSNLNLTKIKFIKNKKNGPNQAILTGIESSNANSTLVFMADDFLNIDLINIMFEKIQSGYELIIPSRFLYGGTFKNKNIFKKLITILGYISIHYIAQIPYRDCTNAFKMFSNKIKKNIFFESTYGFTFALELTIKCHHLGYKIFELPAQWEELNNRKRKFKIFKWLPFYLYWLLYAILLNFKIIKI